MPSGGKLSYGITELVSDSKQTMFVYEHLISSLPAFYAPKVLFCKWHIF